MLKQLKNTAQLIKNANLQIDIEKSLLNRSKLSIEGFLLYLNLKGVDYIEEKGLFVNYEKSIGDENLIRIYVGLYGVGIIASYDYKNSVWYSCQSRGNHGKNWASGGNWSTTHTFKPSQYVPHFLFKILKGL